MKKTPTTPVLRDHSLTQLEQVVLALALESTIQRGPSKSKHCFPSPQDLARLKRLRKRYWSGLLQPKRPPEKDHCQSGRKAGIARQGRPAAQPAGLPGLRAAP